MAFLSCSMRCQLKGGGQARNRLVAGATSTICVQARYEYASSSARLFRMGVGVHQGSVLSPQLFISVRGSTCCTQMN